MTRVKTAAKMTAVKRRPKRKAAPSLRELLSRITKKDLHPETDTGPPVGKEVD